MNSPETRKIVKHIDLGVLEIRNRIQINTVIFSILTALVLLLVVVVFVNLRITWGVASSAATGAAVAAESNTIAAKNTARLDAIQDGYINYINQVIALINKLQKDNPQIKVPKAMMPRPPGVPAPAESDLDRPKYEHPGAGVSPTPTTKTRTIIKYKTKRPSPTPKPWYQFFKSTR
jgi:hypothetical protein